MTTATRTEINQANAQHSTGPKTHEGKKKSSLNALRHGLTGQIVVMPTEDLHIYQRHLKSFSDEYHPQGATEAHLVQALADTAWRLNRVAALETNLLSQAAADTSLEAQSEALANLSLHSQRLSRQFERTVTQLRELQQTRVSREDQELDEYLDVVEMFERKGEAYDPTADGFVFSQSQINRAILARNRERLFEEACETAPA
jgi:cysteinyl-tRNA synthetase